MPPSAVAEPAASTLVELDHVSVDFGALQPALADVSLRAQRSELLVLQGAAGSGKTTLLNLVAGLQRPTAGTVRIAGQDLAALRPAAFALLRRSMGIVTEQPQLLDALSVRDNVALPARLAGLSRDEAMRRADAALERLGLDPAVGLRAAGTVGGSARQRVALARAIVNRPALLILDQPTCGLDDAETGRVLQMLEQFAVAGVCVLAASNDPLPWPARARRLRLEHGRLGA